MSVYTKLMQARIELQKRQLKKSGHNKFAGYQYFELGDFLPTVQEIFSSLKLCGFISFYPDSAALNILDTEDNTQLLITSPMASANLKGAHDIQNLGAVQTYLRRYLWITAMEIVEHDAIDSSPMTQEPKKDKVAMSGKTGEWQLSVTGDESNFPEAMKAAVDVSLGMANSADDVKAIYRNNKALFEKLKDLDKESYDSVMGEFKSKQEELK